MKERHVQRLESCINEGECRTNEKHTVQKQVRAQTLYVRATNANKRGQQASLMSYIPSEIFLDLLRGYLGILKLLIKNSIK